MMMTTMMMMMMVMMMVMMMIMMMMMIARSEVINGFVSDVFISENHRYTWSRVVRDVKVPWGKTDDAISFFVCGELFPVPL